MISLNLIASQGIRSDGKIIDLSREAATPAPTPIPTMPGSAPPARKSKVAQEVEAQPAAETEIQATEEQKTAQVSEPKPEPPKGPSVPKPKPKIDASVFDMVEKNLDMIEDAEKEELKAPKRKVLSEEKKPVQTRKRHPFRRFFLAIIFVAIVLFAYAWFSGRIEQRDIERFYRNNVATLIHKVFPQKGKNIAGTAQRIGEQLPGVVQDAADVASSTISALEPLAVTNEISDYYIEHIQRGSVILEAVIAIFEKLPPSSRFSYLDANPDKITFVVYVPSREVGLRLKEDLEATGQFQYTDVFFIERTGGSSNPYQVMAALNTTGDIPKRSKGFRHLQDQEISQTLGTIGQQNHAKYGSFQIQRGDSEKPRKTTLSGRVTYRNLVPFLMALEKPRINLGTENLHISDKVGGRLDISILDFTLEAHIYPRKS